MIMFLFPNFTVKIGPNCRLICSKNTGSLKPDRNRLIATLGNAPKRGHENGPGGSLRAKDICLSQYINSIVKTVTMKIEVHPSSRVSATGDIFSEKSSTPKSNMQIHKSR